MNESAKMKAGSCPLCGLSAETEWMVEIDDHVYYCDNCGTYVITYDARERRLPDYTSQQKSLIGGFLCERNLLGRERFRITSENIDMIFDYEVPQTVNEKIERLLQNLARLTPVPGNSLEINTERQYSLAYAEGKDEIWTYLKWLRKRNYIEAGSDSLNGGKYTCKVSVDGWQKVDEMGGTSYTTDRVFIAMRFNDRMRGVCRNGLASAVSDAGYTPICLIDEEHNGLIDDKIITEIRRARFIIADLTGNRPSVYFEAGFALGLDKQVIWTCDKESGKSVHFDTDHYSRIIWTDVAKLREDLYNRIVATLGFGPHYSPQ